jgi:hypothetical protein
MANVKIVSPSAVLGGFGPKRGGLKQSNAKIQPGAAPGPTAPPDKPDNAEAILRPASDADLVAWEQAKAGKTE